MFQGPTLLYRKYLSARSECKLRYKKSFGFKKLLNKLHTRKIKNIYKNTEILNVMFLRFSRFIVCFYDFLGL